MACMRSPGLVVALLVGISGCVSTPNDRPHVPGDFAMEMSATLAPSWAWEGGEYKIQVQGDDVLEWPGRADERVVRLLLTRTDGLEAVNLFLSAATLEPVAWRRSGSDVTNYYGGDLMSIFHVMAFMPLHAAGAPLAARSDIQFLGHSMQATWDGRTLGTRFVVDAGVPEEEALTFDFHATFHDSGYEVALGRGRDASTVASVRLVALPWVATGDPTATTFRPILPVVPYDGTLPPGFEGSGFPLSPAAALEYARSRDAVVDRFFNENPDARLVTAELSREGVPVGGPPLIEQGWLWTFGFTAQAHSLSFQVEASPRLPNGQAIPMDVRDVDAYALDRPWSLWPAPRHAMVAMDEAFAFCQGHAKNTATAFLMYAWIEGGFSLEKGPPQGTQTIDGRATMDSAAHLCQTWQGDLVALSAYDGWVVAAGRR